MSRRQIIELLESSGYMPVETPILQPADVFLDLAGEDIRTRLFLTEDEDGQALCLRPEHTIPICRHHIASGDAARPANYGYLGPTFRFRPGETGEFLQAGIESIGREDRLAAEAEVMALSASLASAGGLSEPVTISATARSFQPSSMVWAFRSRAPAAANVRLARDRVLKPRLLRSPSLSKAKMSALMAAIAAATPDDAQRVVNK